MIVPILIASLGLVAGFLLLRRVQGFAAENVAQVPRFSIVIPVRNEEANLPRLLRSIYDSNVRPIEVIVVDDGSSDKSADIARHFGAAVVVGQPLPADWTGKAWACFQGAWQSRGDYILFLDADTFFVDDGLERLVSSYSRELGNKAVFSVLPYHHMQDRYEQLSLFFNLLMAAGAGGFGGFSEPQLFGQCLFISRVMYFACGGHAVVRDAVIENLSLARPLRERGATIKCISGHGVLHMRMFPGGMRQMTESWSKSFVRGAAASPAIVLGLSASWITCLWSTPSMLLFAYGRQVPGLCAVYLLMVVQLFGMARKFGNYRIWTCFLYPIPLMYYCTVFTAASARLAFGRKFLWRGREV